MTVKVLRFLFPHASVPLLHHLRIGNQSIKRNIYLFRFHDICQEFVKCNNNTPNRVLRLQVMMNEAIKVNRQNVGLKLASSKILLDMFMISDKACDIVRNSHCLTSPGYL